MQPDKPLAVFEADGPDRGKLEARGPLEQWRLDKLLESLHLQADGRLRTAEFLGRAGEAARLDNGDESPDDVDRNAAHGLAPSSSKTIKFIRLIHGSPARHKRAWFDHQPVAAAEKRAADRTDREHYFVFRFATFSIPSVIRMSCLQFDAPRS